MKSSEYIEAQRREFALYTLEQRAIPHAADGLKNAMRRILWTARNGKHYKSASLAGATMPIHPHDQPNGAVNTLAAHFGNNIPLLKGSGGFGTLLDPTSFSASKYTTVEISQFAKDALFRDIELIPMQPNYDDTLEEPTHFLPLVPMAIVNGQQGIAIGFAATILPRNFEEIIKAQIQVLNGKSFREPMPYIEPNDCWAYDWEEGNEGTKFWFSGEVDVINGTTVRVTKLPHGLLHEAYVNGTSKVPGVLDRLISDGTIVNHEDGSSETVDIVVKFKRGHQPKDNDELLQKLGLQVGVHEYFTLIGFDGTTVWQPTVAEYIEDFTAWRLRWYKDRYERLKRLLEVDMQKYLDIMTAITNDVGGKAKSKGSRSALKEFLTDLDIVYVDYIADLPVYRFTKDEKKKVEAKLAVAKKTLAWYNKLLRSPAARRDVYIEELTEILTNYKKRIYAVES